MQQHLLPEQHVQVCAQGLFSTWTDGVDHYPGSLQMSPLWTRAAPDLNTHREDFIIETGAVSEAFPPCQEK